MQVTSATEAVSDLARRVPEGGRLYLSGSHGEPLAVREALRQAPETLAGRIVCGLWLPGLNSCDYAGFHEKAESETSFLMRDQRESFMAGKVRLLPHAYTGLYHYFERCPLDAAIIRVCAPDAKGTCNLGPSADFAPGVLARDCFKIAEIDASLPPCAGAPTIALDQFDLVIEADHGAAAFDPGPLSDEIQAVMHHVAPLVPDGAVLQFGIGSFQTALLEALSDKRRLRIHSGMVSDGILPLLEHTIPDEEGAVTCGVALGSQALYEQVSRDRRIRFAPVPVTHGFDVLSKIERFIAVNSVMSMDLFGQANAEFLGTKQMGGAGGLSDFVRGAHASPGGRAILALPATAKNGTVSRIVPHLPTGTVPALTRTDAPIVVTEYGVADLRDLTLDARAQALIAVAAPAFRDNLQTDWDRLRQAM